MEMSNSNWIEHLDLRVKVRSGDKTFGSHQHINVFKALRLDGIVWGEVNMEKREEG